MDAILVRNIIHICKSELWFLSGWFYCTLDNLQGILFFIHLICEERYRVHFRRETHKSRECQKKKKMANNNKNLCLTNIITLFS